MGVGGMAFLDGFGKILDLDRREDVPGLGKLRTLPENFILGLRGRDGNPQVILAQEVVGGALGKDPVAVILEDVGGPGEREGLLPWWPVLEHKGDGT